jgi:hypothetical protein
MNLIIRMAPRICPNVVSPVFTHHQAISTHLVHQGDSLVTSLHETLAHCQLTIAGIAMGRTYHLEHGPRPCPQND